MSTQNDVFALARRITEIYLKESRERFDAADRAQLARKMIEKSGDMETLERYYSDPQTALAVEFLEEPGDHTFTHLDAFMKRKSQEKGGRTQ